MSTRSNFRQSDVTRLYRAAKAAGLEPEDVEIEAEPDGTLRLRPIVNRPNGDGRENPWDEVLRK
nr:hypothetical protein [uncultured Sphaerochaeta sp.]